MLEVEGECTKQCVMALPVGTHVILLGIRYFEKTQGEYVCHY